MKFFSFLAAIAVCFSATSADAEVISINFNISENDNNSVDADESAVTLPVGRDISGLYWNSVELRNSSAGTPGLFTAATQGGSSISLIDDTGASVASMTSVGTFHSEFSDSTDGANRGLFGEAGLVQSYVNLNNNESITITGLADDFQNGYDVVIYNEAGDIGRTMGLRVEEGPGGNDVDQMLWYQQQVNPDGDANDDGLVEWVETLGADAANATLHGNYSVFSGLSADSFTIYGSNNGGRSILNGLQIIGLPSVPEPSTFALAGFGLLGVGLFAARRKR